MKFSILIYICVFFFFYTYIEKLRDNTILCLERKIGYNTRSYLRYKPSWNYSIEFYFDIENMHSTDLFIILYSYLRNQSLYCLDVYTLAEQRSKTRIFSRKTGYELGKMTYREFESWWEKRQWYDSSLLDPKEIYGFRLAFVPELLDSYLSDRGLNMEIFQLSYKPSYPWSSDVISFFENFIDESNEGVFWDKTLMHRYYKAPLKYKNKSE